MPEQEAAPLLKLSARDRELLFRRAQVDFMMALPGRVERPLSLLILLKGVMAWLLARLGEPGAVTVRSLNEDKPVIWLDGLKRDISFWRPLDELMKVILGPDQRLGYEQRVSFFCRMLGEAANSPPPGNETAELIFGRVESLAPSAQYELSPHGRQRLHALGEKLAEQTARTKVDSPRLLKAALLFHGAAAKGLGLTAENLRLLHQVVKESVEA